MASGTSIQYLLLRHFPHLGSDHQIFNLHVLRSCASSICTPFSFMSFLITSLHLLSFGVHPLPCSHDISTSPLSFSRHGLTLSVSLLLFYHLFATPAFALIYAVQFSILFIPITHLNMTIQFLSSVYKSTILHFLSVLFSIDMFRFVQLSNIYGHFLKC